MNRMISLLLTAALAIPLAAHSEECCESACGECDAPIFRDKPDSRISLLTLPLVSLFETRREGKESVVRVADATLARVFRRDDDNGEVRTRFLTTFLGGIYDHESDGWSSRTRVLPLPLTTSLARTDAHGEQKKQFRLLKLPILGSFFEKGRDGSERLLRVADYGPIVSAYRRETDGDDKKVRLLGLPLSTCLYRVDREGDSVDRRFIKLPILGSAYSHQRDAKRSKTKLLWIFTTEREITKD